MFSNSHQISDSHGVTVSRVPWYEYEPFQEISSRTYYQIEEVVEKYIGLIFNQDPRHALLKVGQRKPIPICTAYIEDVPVREEDIEAFKEKVYNKVIDAQGTRYARLSVEVDKEIDGRDREFLKLEAHKKSTYDSYDIPQSQAKRKAKEKVPARPKRKR